MQSRNATSQFPRRTWINMRSDGRIWILLELFLHFCGRKFILFKIIVEFLTLGFDVVNFSILSILKAWLGTLSNNKVCLCTLLQRIVNRQLGILILGKT